MNSLGLTSKIKDLGIRLRPTVSLEKIGKIEAQLGIKFPEDYVLFVTRIEDGWDKQVVNRFIWQEIFSLGMLSTSEGIKSLSPNDCQKVKCYNSAETT